jgi:hypothetical protein
MDGPPNAVSQRERKSSRKTARVALKLLFTSVEGKAPEVRNLKQVAYFPRTRIAFNRLQKNGNSTAMSFLHYLEHGEHQAAGEAKAHALHLSDLGARGVFALTRAKRLIVVRDPFSHTLSAFLDKFRSPNYRRNFGEFALSPEGFSEFLSFLDNGGLRANAHWAPQTDRILLATEKYDAVVPFSAFPTDLVGAIEQWVPGAHDKWSEFSGEEIGGPPATHAGEKVAAFYNRDDLATVERLFQADLAVPQIRQEADRVRESYEQLSDEK